MARLNFAPTWRTIIVALILMALGIVAAFTALLPDRLGAVAFAVAGVVMLLGIVLRKL
jgi:hypothetical protein